MNDTDSQTLNWMIGIVLFVVMISMIAQTKAGYAIIYWALVLLLVFVAVTQSPWIAQELSYVTQGPPVAPASTTGTTGSKTAPAQTITLGAYGPAGLIPL